MGGLQDNIHRKVAKVAKVKNNRLVSGVFRVAESGIIGK